MNHTVMKLTDDAMDNIVGGGNSDAMMVSGYVIMLLSVAGAVASGVTSLVYRVRASNALRDGDYENAKKFDKISNYTCIGHYGAFASAIGGAILGTFGCSKPKEHKD